MSGAFEFTPEKRREFEEILKRYPVKRAALLPTLYLAQAQNGYISPEAEVYVGKLLDVPLVDVREVLTFYTLFHRRPPGRHHIRVCTSLSCWIRGSDAIKAHLESELGVASGGVTEDGTFSWEAVPDCLGACELAPMMQVDDDYQGNLTSAQLDQVLAALLEDEKEHP
ncbi:MAG: NADH-quinone oxidoreductase subunit NuoE [Acidobacteriota bacterium]